MDFSHVVSTGHECVGPDTISTMQSFQTRLLKDMNGNFRVVTHVTACRQGKCYSFDVHNHFHLIRNASGAMTGMPFRDARKDFLGDMGKIFTSGMIRTVQETPVINAESGYDYINNKLYTSSVMTF